ncbi:MAG: hypothetical protein IAE99_10065 [Rhodothermales bacterium]|nr:hypothetical protein [Rhodothermales bacterium]
MATHRLEIDDEVWPLVEAALRFGDRLAELSFVTDEQRMGIATIQAALRRLPEVTPGLSGEYELEVMSSEWAAFNETAGRGPVPEPCYLRTFSVEHWNRDDKYGINIGGLNHPPERGTSPETEFAGDEHETWYEVYTSGTVHLEKPWFPDAPDRPWWQHWASGTENPAVYIAPGVCVVVNVSLGPLHWTTDSEGRSRTYDFSDEEWWKGRTG